MKFIALSALIATASAGLGDDCYYDKDICTPDGLECATWEDGQFGEMASCEDCSNGGQQILDSMDDPVTYKCAEKAGTSDGGAPTTPADGGASEGEEKSTTIALSAVALIAASAIYA